MKEDATATVICRLIIFFAVSFKPMNEIASSLTRASKFLILLPLIKKEFFYLSASHTQPVPDDKGLVEEVQRLGKGIVRSD